MFRAKPTDNVFMRLLKATGHYIIRSLFLSSVLSLSITVFAEELSKIDSDAIDKTVELLNNPSQRQQVIDNNDGAKKADQMARQLLGDGADLQQVYKAAGEIFRKLANENNGDLNKMLEKMAEGQKNPESFFNSLTPKERAMVQSLGQKANERKQLQASP